MPESPGPPRKRGRGADTAEMRSQLVAAAFTSLLEEGFRGTTARAIAARAQCNQAAIYYHFGGIEPLLIAALTQSSERRLERYRTALVDIDDIAEVLAALETLYAEDRTEGHLGVLAELVGGITANPDLQAGIEHATGPWLDFVEQMIEASTAALPFGALVPARDVADLIFSLVIGVELRNRIDGHTERAERFFRLGAVLAALLPPPTAER